MSNEPEDSFVSGLDEPARYNDLALKSAPPAGDVGEAAVAELVKRATDAIKLAERMSARGSHPSNIYNIADAMASTLTRLSADNADLVGERDGLRKAAVWQPIETAPKDGTSALLYVDGRVSVGAWRAISEWVEGPTPAQAVKTLGLPKWHGPGVPQRPTHWMPLPAAPTNSEPTA